VLAAALLLAAAAPHSQTPQAFVANLYAYYRNRNFSPFRHVEAIFAPRLAAAIRLDEKRSPPDEVGALDWDPICGCQDWSKLRPEIRRIAPISPDRVALAIRLYDMNHHHSLSLVLERTTAGWRVADILDRGSLLALLDRANGERRKLRRRH